jgi:predicted transcriptional regulator
MEEGFIISNKIRKAVFIEIASGEKSLSRLIKKHHLIEQAARNAIEELKEHGLIEEKEDGYVLTELGKKIYGKLKGSETL